jgi:hypothetical protein
LAHKGKSARWFLAAKIHIHGWLAANIKKFERNRTGTGTPDGGER